MLVIIPNRQEENLYLLVAIADINRIFAIFREERFLIGQIKNLYDFLGGAIDYRQSSRIGLWRQCCRRKGANQGNSFHVISCNPIAKKDFIARLYVILQYMCRL